MGTGRHGLSGAEAASRLAAAGPNKLPDAARRGWPVLLADAAREPMFLLLLGAAGLYLLLGEPRESAFLLLMVVLTLGMTLYQPGGDRNPGLDVGAVRRQDRHADREPDGAAPAAARRRQP
jgi:hypothetical protein